MAKYRHVGSKRTDIFQKVPEAAEDPGALAGIVGLLFIFLILAAIFGG